MPDMTEALDLLSQVLDETEEKHEEEKRRLKRQIEELQARINDLLTAEADSEGNPIRYHGCYNITRRTTPVGSAADLILILGGQDHLSKKIGVSTATISGWRDKHIPRKYRPILERMMKERGYPVAELLWK